MLNGLSTAATDYTVTIGAVVIDTAGGSSGTINGNFSSIGATGTALFLGATAGAIVVGLTGSSVALSVGNVESLSTLGSATRAPTGSVILSRTRATSLDHNGLGTATTQNVLGYEVPSPTAAPTAYGGSNLSTTTTNNAAGGYVSIRY